MDVPNILRWEISAFFALLVALLACQMATGKIQLHGLFAGEADKQRVSLENVLLFAVTMGMAAIYVLLFLRGGGALPDIRKGWLEMFGGGCGLYAAVKAFKMVISKGS